MVKEQNTAVITCMDNNYENNLIEDFLQTLRNDANYKGTIVILDYGMSGDIKKAAQEKYNCSIFQCKRDHKVLFSVRNRDMAACIDSLPSEITHVMSIDGADVWFQNEIYYAFELCENRIGYVECEYNTENSIWTSKLLSILDSEQEKILSKNFRGTKLKNAGTVCGPRELVKQLSSEVYTMTRETNLDFFGLDQIYFNYVINNMSSDKIISLPQKYNYILIEHRKDFILENNKIYDSDNTLVNVVHNAGGLNRVLKRPVDRKKYECIYQKIHQL